jgi:glycosyltransferase involved in cell wall biosynthesis
MDQTAIGRAGEFLPKRRMFKVAIVHEWLVNFGGSEQVLSQLLEIYPDADLFTLVDFLSDSDRARLGGRRPFTSFIQRMPFACKRYRGYLPLMPMAIEQFDLSQYDVVISSSHAVAKGVLTGPNQVHICYCHTPIRYAWDMQHQYLRDAKLTKGIRGILARVILHYIRVWDTRTAAGVDHFICNSAFISRRIMKAYGRQSTVIHPPANTEMFNLRQDKEAFYFTASRMVPYKRIDLIVEAFSGMPDRQLIVIGDGPEMRRLQQLAGPNVILMGYQPDSVLKDHLQRARAFVFAAEEDFGILPVEAQACGTPVIAFGRGGALETVVGPNLANGATPTGIFFHSQTIEALQDAVRQFETLKIEPESCRAWAESFSPTAFRDAWRREVYPYFRNCAAIFASQDT